MKNFLSPDAASWLMACYVAVMVAVCIDLVAGVLKSRRLGIPRTSRRFRKTAQKTGRYLLPMVCLTCIDVLVAGYNRVPMLTPVMAAYNVFCEFRSVMESVGDKEEIARSTDDLKNFVTILERLLKHLK